MNPLVKMLDESSTCAKTDDHKIFIYLLSTAIGLMPGSSVYKNHTFNKETAHIFQEKKHNTLYESYMQQDAQIQN
jgi:hypothetical protein